MYVSLRITPSFVFDASGEPIGETEVFLIINSLRSYLQTTQTLACYEVLNKFGEQTHPHYHINCVSKREIKKQSLNAWFRKFRETLGFSFSGVKSYSFSIYDDVKEVDEWLRYVVKEQLGSSDVAPFNITPTEYDKYEGFTNPVLSYGFTDDWIKDNRKTATIRRYYSVIHNRQLRDSYINKNCFKNTMFRKLKDDLNHQQFCSNVVSYYGRKGKTAPFKLLFDGDLWLDYLLFKERITFDIIYELKKINLDIKI